MTKADIKKLNKFFTIEETTILYILYDKKMIISLKQFLDEIKKAQAAEPLLNKHISTEKLKTILYFLERMDLIKPDKLLQLALSKNYLHCYKLNYDKIDNFLKEQQYELIKDKIYLKI